MTIKAPGLRTLVRMAHAMVDMWCASYERPPKAVTLDVEDTCDTVHGHQQLSLFNAFHDERVSPLFAARPCPSTSMTPTAAIAC